MKITKKWLKNRRAPIECIFIYERHNKKNPITLLELLIAEKNFYWANMLITRVMSYKQYLMYGIFVAEQVNYIYKKMFLNDDRFIEAVESARSCITKNSDWNRKIAKKAARAIYPGRTVDTNIANYVTCIAFFVADVASLGPIYRKRKYNGDNRYATCAIARAVNFASEATMRDHSVTERDILMQKVLNYGIGLLKNK